MINIKKASLRNVVKNVYVIGILLLFIAIFEILNPKFLSAPSIVNIIRTAAPAVMVGVAATLLMISGNIDLSVGSILAFSGVVFATLAKAGIDITVGVLISICAGALIGVMNGVLVVKLKIIPVIATLATMNIFLGISKLMCGDTIPYVKGDIPKAFSFMGRGDFGGIPVQLFIIIGIVLVFMILQKKSVLGKYSVAIGGNPVAARLAGINVDKIVWVLYVLVAACAAFAGCVKSSNMSIADATAGIGFEVDVIIAVLLGGTSFFGGEGSVGRTVAGAFILIILGIGMNQSGVEPFYQYVVKGIVLICAVLLDKLVKEKIRI